MPSYSRVALFGGVYNNHFALAAAIADARRRGCEKLFCLGDLGAFGPHPDKVFPLLLDHGVETMQGNYDNSIGNDLPDCQCGYTDPPTTTMPASPINTLIATPPRNGVPGLQRCPGRFDLKLPIAEFSAVTAHRER